MVDYLDKNEMLIHFQALLSLRKKQLQASPNFSNLNVVKDHSLVTTHENYKKLVKFAVI